jgi:hypothetical protein
MPPPPVLNIPKIKLDTMKLNKMVQGLERMDSSLVKLDKMMLRISDSIKVKDISIGGDSIVITLSNDSVLWLQSSSGTPTLPRHDNSFVNVGTKYTVEEGKVINGNIVNIGGDVIVKGTVNGSVWTIGSNIYVSPTGYIQDGAIAVSGKLKVDPGGQVTNLKLSLNDSRHGMQESPTNMFRVMAVIFLGIYVIWMVLASTFASLMKVNVGRVANLVRARPWKSFFIGYLTYLLAFAAIIVLTISILGIPLAIVGVPVALFAGMVLAVTALSCMIGQRLTNSQETNFRTFLYGSLVLSGLPGLFFLIQLITGSMVIMIFSWLFIGLLIFVVAPFGLGAVLSTRFGTRTILSTPTPPPPASQVTPPTAQIAPQTPPA